jgi:hypothetical protein
MLNQNVCFIKLQYIIVFDSYIASSYYGFLSAADPGIKVAESLGVVSFGTGIGNRLNSNEGSSKLSSFTEKLFFRAIF